MKKTNGRQDELGSSREFASAWEERQAYESQEELLESDMLDSELLQGDSADEEDRGTGSPDVFQGGHAGSADHIDELGTVVKKIRLSLGMTQGDVAKALNVTPGYISNVENNRTAMSLRVLVYYALLTNTTLDTLVGLTQSDYQPTALDNDLLRAIAPLDRRQKEKLLETLRIWTN